MSYVVTTDTISRGKRFDYLDDAFEYGAELSLATHGPVLMARVGRHNDIGKVYKVRFSKVEKRAANPKPTAKRRELNPGKKAKRLMR